MHTSESIYDRLSNDHLRKLQEISVQIQFLEQLRNERLNNVVLAKFAENQKYGKNTDEYKEIMKVYDSSAMDPRIQSTYRMPEFPTWKEDDFKETDANIYKDYVICSSPESEDSVKHFLENICMNTTNNKRRAIDTIILFGTSDQAFEGNPEKKNYFNYLVPGTKKYGRYMVEIAHPVAGDELLHFVLSVTNFPGNSTPSWTKKFNIYQFATNNQLLKLSVNTMDLLIRLAQRKPETVAFQDGSGFSSAASLLLTFRILKRFYIITSGSDDKIQENLVKELRNFRSKRPGVFHSKEYLIQAITIAFDLQQRYLQSRKDNILSNTRSLETSDEEIDNTSSSGSSPASASSVSSSPPGLLSKISPLAKYGSSQPLHTSALSIPINNALHDNKGDNSLVLSKSPPTPPYLLSPRGDHKIHTVGIIVTCDTKSVPAGELRQLFIHQGNIVVYMINIGVRPVEQNSFPIDVETRELLMDDAPAFSTLETINRPAAMDYIKKGIEHNISKIHEQFPFDAIVGFGGTTGSEIVAAAMRKLSHSVCKVLITTAPELYKDDANIYCIKPKCDIGNVLNDHLTKSIRDAVIYVQGTFNVVGKSSPKFNLEMNGTKTSTLAITQFGTSTPLVQAVSEHFSKEGYVIKAYHAKGEGGGKEMEEEIRAGAINVVCDVTLSEVVAEIVHGPWRAGINRMLAAASMGLPTVIVPGCIDMFIADQVTLGTGCYKGRLIRKCNDSITVVRTNFEEYKKVVNHIINMIKNSQAPVIILIPSKGFSAFDSEADDWQTNGKQKGCWYSDFRLDDSVFIANLKGQISQLQNERKQKGIEFPPIQLREFKCNINDPMFAKEVIKATGEVIELHKELQAKKLPTPYLLDGDIYKQELETITPTPKNNYLRSSARSASATGFEFFKPATDLSLNRRLSGHIDLGSDQSMPSPQSFGGKTA